MPGSDWDELREQTHLLAEEARTAADRIAAEVRVMETGERPSGAESAVILRASVRALQAALGQMLDIHGTVPMVARPSRSRVDTLSIAGEVAQELAAEGVPVRVEGRTATGYFYADAAELRRILKTLVERAVTTSDESRGGWIVLAFTATSTEVVFEVPWPDASSAADAEERVWLQRAVRRQAGVFTTVGGLARVVLSSSAREGDGQTETLEREVEAMRRRAEVFVLSLDAARRQGTAYARDVAQLYSDLEARDATIGEMSVHRDRTERVVGAVVKDLRRLLAMVARLAEALAPTGGAAGETATSMLGHLRDVAMVLRRLREVATRRITTGTGTGSSTPPQGGSAHG